MFWKDKKVSYSGDYPRVYWPQHPMSDGAGMLKIHRAVMSESVGRVLVPKEIVHHKDENRCNWSLDNLELTTMSEHSIHHHKANGTYVGARIASIKDSKKVAIVKFSTTCAHCGHSVEIPKRRIAAYENNFCGTKCNGAFQQRIEWPNKKSLEKMVWEKPRTHLSKQLGVSDTAIKKRCLKLGIVMPTKGHWAKNRVK